MFIIISLASSFKTASVLSYYAMFTDDFVERFCENTDRPEMKCNGKCHLKKQLAENNSSASSEFPAQENKRTSLDTFCLVLNEGLNTSLNSIIFSQIIIPHNSSRIIKTSFKVETPPPIFS